MYYMQWYRQQTAQPPRWIITNALAQKKDEISGRYLAAADMSQKNGYLNISELSVDDRAEYYCAVLDHKKRFCEICKLISMPPFKGEIAPNLPECRFANRGHCGGVSVSQTPAEVSVIEGDDLQLFCNYTVTSSDVAYLFWYRQNPSGSLEYLLQRSRYSGKIEGFLEDRFSAKLDESTRTVPLEVSKAQLRDFAMYYCALTGTNKLIFGGGTKLTVEPTDDPWGLRESVNVETFNAFLQFKGLRPFYVHKYIRVMGQRVASNGNGWKPLVGRGFCIGKSGCVNFADKVIFGPGTRLDVLPKSENAEPSIYILPAPKNSHNVGPVCLATDYFPNVYNMSVKAEGTNQIWSKDDASLSIVDRSYSMVGFLTGQKTDGFQCTAGNKSKELAGDPEATCITLLEKYGDEDESFLSLTVLILRLFFLKSIVFNILMTIRVWVS
ncbi:uncharacterized protein LOC121270132 [Carcharodon carcharias]|uniref:uncharacterized protein LOC121270132 n=1 Tax=Carcharodon carcharias TaxID=13397 RepID=UPI001B7DE09B|nr:uncharacterized protein LOC121270132 [Carcharodon carcharias]